MSATTWNPDQYLRYSGLRERPFDELVARIPLASPRRVVDLGCGPGTATVRLCERWPEALVTGVDSSQEMIDKAAGLAIPGRLSFEVGEAASWAPAEDLDVLVSNAMFQWVPGHERVVSRLAGRLRPGGVMAFQVPGNFDEPSHVLLRELVSTGRWDIPTTGVLRDHPVLDPDGYLRLLLGLGLTADVWETTYLQVLSGPDPVLEWTRGTALRPVLSMLSPEEAGDFEEEYRRALAAAYPQDGEGLTVMPFRRIFAVGIKPA